MENTNLTTANPMLMIRRRNVYWVTKLKNQVRKTWGVTYVLLIMEEVLSIKMFKLRNKSHFYHLGRGGGGGEGEGKVAAFWLSQKVESVNFLWTDPTSVPFESQETPPPHPQDPLTPPPLFPSEKWWPIPYFWSALFREWKVYDLFPFLITFPFS